MIADAWVQALKWGDSDQTRIGDDPPPQLQPVIEAAVPHGRTDNGGRNDRGGIFSGAARRSDRQQYIAAGWSHHRVIYFRDHHVSDDFFNGKQFARDGILVDGESFHVAAKHGVLGIGNRIRGG